MKYSLRSGLVLAILALLVLSTQAKEAPRYSLGGRLIHGGSNAMEKAGGDTINLMAASADPTNEPGEPIYDGDFETGSGTPDWNGWTHRDLTQPAVSHWQVSNFNQADPSNHAAWCGDINYPPCEPNDPAGGYGNSWNELISFQYSVPDPGISSTVKVSATLQHDSEPGYDYTYLSYRYQGQPIGNLQIWDGIGIAAVHDSVTYLPDEYVFGTDIEVLFRFRTDGAWSDEDCSFWSAGGCQVDDVNVQVVNGDFSEEFFEDFEHGGDPEDFGFWRKIFPYSVGDFAKIWPRLEDLDSCNSNYSPQVAFIDDGEVVPGTGGSQCIDWCYGPGGYIVTTTGGLIGAYNYLENAIESPVMAWPSANGAGGQDFDGCIFTFSVYTHADVSFASDALPTMFRWSVRSADTDGSAGNGVQVLTDQPWMDRYSWYYGGPEYRLEGDEVTDLLNPGRDEVQVQLVAQQPWGWWWPSGPNGTPAPYFDNVTVKVFPYLGPGMTVREVDLAQDNFPGTGSIDLDDLGSLSVRFDAARNISPPADLRNDPGDSIVVRIVPVRSGSALTGLPKLQYLLDPNPVFSPAFRTAGLPNRGFVEARPAVGQDGQISPDDWAFDFPDTGFLFPGDVLHYYIEATDAVGGPGGSDPLTAIMPADTTDFSTGFGNPLGYDPAFTVHALPTITSDGFGGYDQPDFLFINDFGTGEGINKWYTAIHQIAFFTGYDFDIYHVNDPGSGVGNGIGGRAGLETLAGYSDILYTCGNLDEFTISEGEFFENTDPSDDVGTLAGWLDLGGKDIFLTGDNLASDLSSSGPTTRAFLEDRMGVTLVTNDIRPSIGNQTSPLVQIMPLNPVFSGLVTNWFAFGGCPGINTIDGVDLSGTGQRIAKFEDPLGFGYSYSACTLNILNPGPTQSRVISMPVDLMNVATNPGDSGHPFPARARLLKDVTQYFGLESSSEPSSTEDIQKIHFTTSNAPNPFNPITTIYYSLPRAGHLKLSIYNVRGQLVKTLIDAPRPAGASHSIIWDGTDNLGSAAACGTYFYEARAAGEVRVGKLTLLK